MKKWLLGIGIIVALCSLGRCGWEHFKSAPPEPAKSPEPVARVVLAPIERKTIAETVTAFGSVIVQPGKSHAVSAAFESRVRHTLVAPGEAVVVGQPLVEVDPSPATQLLLAQARGAVEAAQKDLQQAQQKFNLKLATNQDLGAAKKAADMAQLQLQSLEKQGAASRQEIKSEIAGLVGKVDVQDGQIVQAGSPLVELVVRDEIEAKLGVEPKDVGHLSTGQPVTLSQVHFPATTLIVGKIRLLTGRVNPNTRLIDVYVTLPSGSSLFLDAYLRAEMEALAHAALIVPRSAVLPRDDGDILFTIKDSHAVKHMVRIGIQNDTETEIIADDLNPGEQVVVKGNYELSDGMAVAGGPHP